jgi:hypothetical protein
MVPIRSPLGRSVLGGCAGVGLAVLLATQPVLAADCATPAARLSPGDWSGGAAFNGATFHDGATEMITDHYVSLAFHVSDSGAVEGDFVLNASGVMQGKQADINSVAAWSIDAELSGVPTEITATGTLAMAMQGVIDISGGDGEDPLGGPTHMGSAGGLEKETEFTFGPDAANCAVASGDFGDNFRVQHDGGELPLGWIAFRAGAPKIHDQLHDRYNQIVDEAMRVLGADEVDVTELTFLVAKLIGFNNVLAQPEYCTSVPQELRPGTHANVIAQQLLGAALTHAMGAATDGAYTTEDVIKIMTLGLQAAALDAPECGPEPDKVYADRAELMGMFETVLELRLDAARENGDHAEIGQILAAAYQFGLYGLLEG